MPKRYHSMTRRWRSGPDFLEALFNRAGLLLELKRHDAALESRLRRVVALRPDVATAWNNRGSALLRGLQRLDEALASFELRATALNPAYVNALTNRAMMLWDLRRLDEAVGGHRPRRLPRQPGHAEALYTRANILRDLGRMAEALAGYEQAGAHPNALNGAAQAALALCDWQKVETLAPRLKANAAQGPALIQPFVLLGYDDDPALQRACAENYVRRTVPARGALASRAPCP